MFVFLLCCNKDSLTFFCLYCLFLLLIHNIVVCFVLYVKWVRWPYTNIVNLFIDEYIGMLYRNNKNNVSKRRLLLNSYYSAVNNQEIY